MKLPLVSVDAPTAEECLEAELKALYEEHASSLVRYARSYAGDAETARDAVQDCFMRYFELRRGGMKMKNPKAWLARVVKNQLIDEGRKEQRQREVGEGEASDPPLANDPMELVSLWQQIAELVSPKELECLRLRAAGYSYAEIAETLGVQPGTVSVFLSRSREKTTLLFHPLGTPTR